MSSFVSAAHRVVKPLQVPGVSVLRRIAVRCAILRAENSNHNPTFLSFNQDLSILTIIDKRGVAFRNISKVYLTLALCQPTGQPFVILSHLPCTSCKKKQTKIPLHVQPK